MIHGGYPSLTATSSFFCLRHYFSQRHTVPVEGEFGLSKDAEFQ